MNCTECGTQCVRVECDSTETANVYLCPSCFNEFRKPVRAPRPKYVVWTKDESGWNETAHKPMAESQAVKKAGWYRSECGVQAKALPVGSKPEAA